MLQTMEERSLVSYRICNPFAQSAPVSYPKLSDPVPKIPQMQHGLMELDSSRYRNKRISLFDWISFAYALVATESPGIVCTTSLIMYIRSCRQNVDSSVIFSRVAL